MDQKESADNVKEYSAMLDTGFRQMAAGLAGLMAQEEAGKPNQVVSAKAQKERFEKQLTQELSLFKKRVEDGAYQIMQSLIQLSEKDKEMFSEEVIKDLARLVGLSNIIANNPAEFFDQTDQNSCLQKIAKVSDATLEKMYNAAKWIYEQNQFKEASDAFGFLTILNPTRHAFWYGLANSEFFNRNYEPALLAYAFCAEVNPSDPMCHLLSCRCYEAIQEVDNAINALDLALYVINDQQEYAGMKQEIMQEKQRLSQIRNK